MLLGIDPLLTGEVLNHLDRMGHSDAVAVVDAHFPAHRVGGSVAEMPGVDSPSMVRAVCTVLPLDDDPALVLMATADGDTRPVQDELVRVVAGAAPVLSVDRFDFYERATRAALVIRTGETRSYGNALLHKGIVTVEVTS